MVPRTRMKSLLATLLVFLCSMSLQGAFSPGVEQERFASSRGPSSHNGLEQSNKQLLQRKSIIRRGDARNNNRQHSYTRRSLSLVSVSSSQWLPLYLSSLAGASTCLGAAIVFLHPKQKDIGVPPSTMSFSLALAGSVMITVSVLSLGPECLQDPLAAGEDYVMMPLWSRTFVERLVSFLLGCCLYRLLSYFAFPEPDELVLKLGPAPTQDDMQLLDSDSHHASKHNNAQHAKLTIRSRRPSTLSPPFPTSLVVPLDSAASFDEIEQIPQQEQEKVTTMSSTISDWSSGRDLESGEQRRAWRVAMLLFISLLIHNFPEGLAVAASAMESTKLGVTVAFGIMIHNIPEGIAIAVPCLAARPDKPWMAFLLASGSGLAEPLGAAVAWMFLRNQSTFPLENVLAFVAGIMIMVALCELFPEAKRHDTPKYFVTGTLTGIAIMGMTELYLP